MVDSTKIHEVFLKVQGKVQGVGYRAWVLQQARDLNLQGWVRNDPEGSVSLCAQGEPRSLKLLEENCWKGPRNSRVENVEVLAVKSGCVYEDFEINY